MPSCDVDITKVSLDGKVIKAIDVKSEGNKITLTVTTHDALLAWANKTIGYEPVLSGVPDSEAPRGTRIYLIFENDTDAMLFKIHFAQAWTMALDDAD